MKKNIIEFVFPIVVAVSWGLVGYCTGYQKGTSVQKDRDSLEASRAAYALPMLEILHPDNYFDPDNPLTCEPPAWQSALKGHTSGWYKVSVYARGDSDKVFDYFTKTLRDVGAVGINRPATEADLRSAVKAVRSEWDGFVEEALERARPAVPFYAEDGQEHILASRHPDDIMYDARDGWSMSFDTKGGTPYVHGKYHHYVSAYSTAYPADPEELGRVEMWKKDAVTSCIVYGGEREQLAWAKELPVTSECWSGVPDHVHARIRKWLR